MPADRSYPEAAGKSATHSCFDIAVQDYTHYSIADLHYNCFGIVDQGYNHYSIAADQDYSCFEAADPVFEHNLTESAMGQGLIADLQRNHMLDKLLLHPAKVFYNKDNSYYSLLLMARFMK